MSCLVGLFGLKSFHGFASLAQLENVTDIAYLLFYSLLLFYFLWPAAVKTFQKHNMLQQEHTKRVK